MTYVKIAELIPATTLGATIAIIILLVKESFPFKKGEKNIKEKTMEIKSQNGEPKMRIGKNAMPKAGDVSSE